jgi:YesN/AraC family two-component response regulator
VFRTLIVDDEPIARQVLRDAFDALSDIAIIGEAENGASAIDLIERFTPDLVFLDLQMPELGGTEVIGRMSARRLPAIIVVSACEKSSREALRAGAAGYLLKPVTQGVCEQRSSSFDRFHPYEATLVRTTGRGDLGFR